MAAQEIWLRLKKDPACPMLQTKARTANGSRAGGGGGDRSSPAPQCPSANPMPMLQPQTCISNPSANPSANPMPILQPQTFSPNPSANLSVSAMPTFQPQPFSQPYANPSNSNLQPQPLSQPFSTNQVTHMDECQCLVRFCFSSLPISYWRGQDLSSSLPSSLPAITLLPMIIH